MDEDRLEIPLFRPYQKLIAITIRGKKFEIPENQILLRAFQYLCPETIPYGRYCWNEECQYCRVTVDQGEGTPSHVALSCKLMVKSGMRVTDMAQEVKYCLRTLDSGEEKK